MTYLGLDRNRQVDACDVAAAITPDTALVSVVHANNQTATTKVSSCICVTSPPLTRVARPSHTGIGHRYALRAHGRAAVDP